MLIPTPHAAHPCADDPPDGAAVPALRPQDLSWIVDELDYGLIAVDDDLVPRFANRCAQELLAEGRSLRLAGPRLQAGAAHHGALRDAVARAAQGLRSMLVLDDELGLAVLPWRAPQRVLPGRAVAVLVLGRSRLGERLTVQGFARCHQLTPTETSLLEHLCDGATPIGAARLMGVAISTVRTHIASIRAKTATTSVGNLLCRVARQPPMRCTLRASNPG